MLHVRYRRILSLATIVTFVALSVVAAYVVRERYSARSIQLSAENAMSRLFGCDVALDAFTFTGEGGVSWKFGSLNKGPLELASLEEVAIESVPPPWRRWDIDEVGIGVLTVTVDLESPGDSLSRCGQLLALLPGILERAVPLHRGPGPAQADESAPRLELLVAYRGAELISYDISSDAVVRDGVFEMSPHGAARPAGWSFTGDARWITLSANTGEATDELCGRVLAGAGARVLDRVAKSEGGTFRAVWDERGESVLFSSDDGWAVTQAALEGLGLRVPAGRLDARVGAFEVRDGRLASLKGSIEYSCERIAAATLSAWLEAGNLGSLGESEAPEHFENLSLAARFELEDGRVAIEPVEERPALVWAEVNGETIILLRGGGGTGLDEFLANAAQIPPEAQADKQPERTKPEAQDSGAAREHDGPETPPQDAPESLP